ncbi:MAG TPA: RidA family protein [Rhodospirillales bacterium]|jgi:enamine deaminase RidA (YjgF/YER057c/UK114 family)|nr:RidA family protein [Rhodospirillales bacterium]HJO87962.1 RidA family protein [Rhodospirillales bacterium]
MGKIDERLKELGIEIPAAAIPKAAKIETYQIYNNTLRVSGQLPAIDGDIKYFGHVGREQSLEDGQAAARLSVLNVLAQAKHALGGDLDRIERVLNLRGFVATVEGFDQVAQVVNGASELMHDIFGEQGKHTRTAAGVAAMPYNVTVEIEGLFALKE